MHIDKLARGTLKPFYSKHKYTDELSDKCYLIDKNLEKQVVSMFKNFCSLDNTEMQNYIREQSNNKSYNMVEIMVDYSHKFMDHLHFPIAYDTFLRVVEALLEFIQGPNVENQEILIERNFVEVGNNILKLDYRNTDELKFEEVHLAKDDYTKALTMMYTLRSMKAASTNQSDDIPLNEEKVTKPVNNMMISVMKCKCVQVLLQMLAGRSPTSYVYYTYRRVFEPDVFRLNFAYQNYFIEKYHKDEYSMDMFFRLDQDLDSSKTSPIVIELGFNLYFLLMLMRGNLMMDMDEVYKNRLINLISLKDNSSTTIQRNILSKIIRF